MSLTNILPDSMRGLQAKFFKGPNPVFHQDKLTELQDFYTISQLDLDWDDRPAGSDIPTDNFSAVFEGKLVADQAGAKNYTLYLNTEDDEGVRLYVGNKKLIDTWNTPTANELKTTVSLTGGEAKDIRLEYKEGAGKAKLKLEWEAEGLSREVIPEQNFVRHGYGAVDESDLVTIRVAKNGDNNIDIIENPTSEDAAEISQQTFASIQNAIDQAEALMNTGQGVKILISPGEYRVSDYGDFGIVLGDQTANSSDKFDLNAKGRQAPLVIEGTGPGVRILGSQRWQDGWQSIGNGVYKHEWTKDWGFEVPQNGKPPADPITHRREAVFVKGKRLDPILFQAATYNTSTGQYTFGKKNDPTEDLKQGQFTVDEDSNVIYIKLQPGATINDKIEVAQAEQLFRAHEPKNNLVLRNLEFAHAATRYANQYAFAAVDIGGAEGLESKNIVIDNVSVNNNSGAGLRLRYSEDITVRDSNFKDNGASGIAAKHLNDIVLRNINAEYNNWRGELGDYRGWFVAGIKIAYTENITADNFNASQNYTHGYWYDLNVKNSLFTNGIVENNEGNGLFVEVSDGPHQIIDSISRNNEKTGVLINTSPNVFLQGNSIVNNGTNVEGNEGDSEIRVGPRKDREANEPELPDIVENVTLIDNIIQNTSDSNQNELIERYGNVESYENLIKNELVANHNVYWDKTDAPAFELRPDKKVRFSEVDAYGKSWLMASQRDNFEAGSVFEIPKIGKVKPIYTGSFAATVAQGNSVVLTSEQLAVSDPDTYAFDLNYTLTDISAQGSLRLRGVRLDQNDKFSLADVERGWVSYTHEASQEKDDVIALQVSDDTRTIAPKNLSLTIGKKDNVPPVPQTAQQDESLEIPTSAIPQAKVLTPTEPEAEAEKNNVVPVPKVSQQDELLEIPTSAIPQANVLTPTEPKSTAKPEPDEKMGDKVIGEYGTLKLNQEWQTVALDKDYINPVVIVSEPTLNGLDPATVRVQKVTKDTFQLRLQEPKYKDGNHTNESAAYVVLEAGDWKLADGTRISVGTHLSNKLTSKGFDSIALNDFGDTPAILSQVQTTNGGDWVTTRIKEHSKQGFQLAMQEEEKLNNGGHLDEIIGWLALSQGVASDGDTVLQGGMTGRSVGSDLKSVKFEEAFEEAPSIIAKLGSFYGSDTANVRIDDISNISFGAKVYEEQSLDQETSHTTESVAFLALEGQAGTLTGISV